MKYCLIVLSWLFAAHILAEEPELYQYRHNGGLTQWSGAKEQQLIAHVKRAITYTEGGISGIDDQKIFEIDGMSSRKVRQLLNNLCTLPGSNYLEIGPWKGSTWVSALYNNQETIHEAVAIDNYSQFGVFKEEFLANCERFLKKNTFRFLTEDAFALDVKTLFSGPVNIYFYDGCLREESLTKAFTYYNEIFDDVFIAVVDDWNHGAHRHGTFVAFEQLGYKVVFEVSLQASKGYWQGQYLAIIRK